MADEQNSGTHPLTPSQVGLSWSDDDQRIFVSCAATWGQVAEAFLDDLDRMMLDVAELREHFGSEARLQRHREQVATHLRGMLQDPREPSSHQRSHEVGMAHIAAGVSPSSYVMAYNRIFAVLHHVEAVNALPSPLDVIRKRWLWDHCDTLDAYHEELNRQAGTDSLTGLANRRAIQEAVIAGRTGRCALVVLDLDGFKSLNDRLGHVRGDEVLTDLGEALSRAVRHSDRAGRLGGDEFCVWMPDVNAATVSARCRMVVEVLPLKSLGLSISAGIALQPDHGESFAELYTAADTALYQVKRHGKAGFALAGSESVMPWESSPEQASQSWEIPPER